MSNVRRKQIFRNTIAEFCKENKRLVIYSCVLFTFGVLLGLIFTVSSEYAIEEFEISFGAGRVFAKFLIISLISYSLVVFSGVNTFVAVLAYCSIFVVGAMLGNNAAILVGACKGLGIINLVLVYLPFYLCTGILISTAICVAAPYRDYSACKRIFVELLRSLVPIFGTDILVAIVTVFFFGSLFRVIIV